MAFKGRKATTKNPPFFSHEFVIQNYADIVSCVAMIFVVGLMIQVTSPLAYMFIAVHHNVSSDQLATGFPVVTRYTYGYKDLCAIFFYFLICIVMHAIIQEYVLDKISRKLHLSKVKHSKFNESGQLLVFYAMSVLWGGDTILKENLVLNISSLWEGYPHNEMTFMFKFFFIIQMSYWLHCYPELYFQRTKREEMSARIQYATVGLVYVAAGYLLNFNRVAICLLVIHYFSEALFHVARLVDFFDKEEKGIKAGYMVSDVVFVLARLASIILSVLTFWYGLSLSDTQGLDVPSGNFNVPAVRLFSLATVCLLQAYLMFHFITDKLRQLREQAPQVQPRKLPSKKPVSKKKKEEESCELHFNTNPMKIVKSKDQYLYDEMGDQYIDFVTRITNVGHCNSSVVEAACQQMAQLSMAVCGEEAKLQHSLTTLLLATLPSSFEVVLFTNSGAEANDLALQMARNYTHRHDLVVVDGAFHGTGNLLVDISPRAFKTSIEGKKPWVHVIPVPDTYRGPYGKDDPEAGEKYFQEAKTVIQRAKVNSHEIAGLICEPVMVVHGVLIPPPQWLSKIYSYIHEIGGIVVADEIQCGMGRTGENFWAFQGQNAVPDIITVGKPLGNGHPIGAVITSRKIAATIKSAEQIYKCDLVGATISMTVLHVMEDKQLMENAQNLGTLLANGFRQLQKNHSVIGDVRQKGLIVGVDIIRSRGSKKPAPDIAEEISISLRKERVLVGCEGDHKNVLLFLPALCLTQADCDYVMETFSQVLTCVELSFLDDLYNILSSHTSFEPSTSLGDQSLSESSHEPFNQRSQNPYDALD